MTRPEVSFYVLLTRSLRERQLFACKLIEKAYRNSCFCYVFTDSSKLSQTLDDLLWTFRTGSFIPHEIFSGEIPAHENKILIGQLSAPVDWQKTIINLSSEYPPDFQNAERIFEILDDSDDTKEAGRLRYRHYQQMGFSITTHKIPCQD